VIFKKAEQIGQEIEKMLNLEGIYSYSVPFPQTSRDRLYGKIFLLEYEWYLNGER